MATMESVAPRARRAPHPLLVFVVAVAVICAIAAAASGFGYRAGLWDFRTGFDILRWAAYIGAGAGIISLIAFIAAAVYRDTANAVLGLVGAIVAAALVLPAWQMQRVGANVPRIHDISTDTDNPPAFVAIEPLRKDAPNPAAYDGPKVAAEQKAAYADIQPIQLAMPPAQAFERALAVARDMGWQIVATEPQQGRIEAIDQTFWFGFKDDVVIRVAAANGGSRVDMRSKSRVGRSDFGTNAKRVRAYLRKLAAK